jgi:hypothetical protein
MSVVSDTHADGEIGVQADPANKKFHRVLKKAVYAST